jgi:Outer membrane protein beta-barrel domain
MKKIFTFAFAVLVFNTSMQSQTKKDWYIIGGNLTNIGLDFQKGNTNFSLNIVPRVAWFVRDDFAIGAEVLLGLKTGDGFTTTNYGVGPIARYYLSGNALESVGKTRWFLDGNVGFYGANTKVSGQESTNTNGLGIGFGPGLAYFINKNIALEAVAKYNLTVGFGNSTTNNALNIGLGFQIYLPKSKLKSIENDVN